MFNIGTAIATKFVSGTQFGQSLDISASNRNYDDTFDFCGVRFKVTQVIGEACYVGAVGSGWDRHVPRPQLQAVLARIGTPAR